MALTIKKKPAATASTTVENKHKGKTTSEKTVQETPDLAETGSEMIAGQLCVVGTDMSYTKNLGDYNSCRVGVSIQIPCKHEEVNDVFTVAKEWANERLTGMIDEIGGPN